MNYTKLSQQMSYILRHAPYKFGLEPDSEGWVPLEELLAAINSSSDFSSATLADLSKAMESSDKKRHEIKEERIRAVYGHSLEQKIAFTPSEPPEILYHGTARRFLSSIAEMGLQPKGRQYVHLSSDRETALLVGRRRDEQPLIIAVKAAEACLAGFNFYSAGDNIWLADEVPPVFLSY